MGLSHNHKVRKRKNHVLQIDYDCLNDNHPCFCFCTRGKSTKCGRRDDSRRTTYCCHPRDPFSILQIILKKNKPQQQRWHDHMDRMEQKYDRIIELMEKMIDHKK